MSSAAAETLQQNTLLLAVSGGADSVVLCELCYQAGFKFSIAHCNFQLRGEESERDEQFVRSLGEKYGVETYVQRFDTKQYAEEKKLSIQVAARELRYNWFNELLTAHNLQLTTLLTAHHADDNIETMLMNFFKGTGISGLHGILPKQNKIVRPLLFAYKEEIKAFAEEKKLAYVEDSSNFSDKYTRNYFRNQLIPAVEKVFPAVKENLAQNINRFREIELLYDQAIQQHKKKLVERKGNEYHIPVLRLQKTRPLETVLYEIIKEFGFTSHQTKEVAALLDSESGRYIASSTHRVIKNRNWLIISPNKTPEAENIPIEVGDKMVEFENGTLTIQNIQHSTFNIQHSSNIACLDACQIQFPLLLRKWRPGDYFYPLGMKKKKKLSRFLIDQKLSLPEKENTWVVEMNKKIIWIVGRRIDERVKVTGATRQIVLLSFKPS
ncbi:MAG TPA: tRNA lysidine(34) synthetase TilS [Chitinophagaceae bacterium]|nr:tRNA lysidine(34) synthetase TilS [Chitinophagaceae bacterium]